MPEEIYVNDSSTNGVRNLFTGSFIRTGSAFISASSGIALNNVIFRLAREGSPTGMVYAKLYAITGTPGTNGTATGDALAVSDGLDIATLNTFEEEKVLSFTGANRIAINPGNYAIVVEYTSGNTSNRLTVSLQTSLGSPDTNVNETYYISSWQSLAYNVVQGPRFRLYGVTATVPTATTQAVSSIGTASATGNGNITATGGVDVSARGFVWDTASQSDPGNTAPGSSAYIDFVSASGTFGTGTFTGSLTGLAEGTTYYVRAWAQNSMGYSYGSEVNFETGVTPPPSAQLSNILSVSNVQSITF